MVSIGRTNRAWLFVIAAGLVIVALAGVASFFWSPKQPDIAGYERPKGPHEGHKAGGKRCEEARLQTLPKRIQANERERCAVAQDRDQAERESLTYAARQAHATEEALRIGHYQATVALWQTLASAAAFIAAFAAVYYAKKSADAAKDTLEVTNLANRRQMRPYLVIATVGIRRIGNSRRRELVISTSNYGQTPAINVKTWRQCSFLDHPHSKEFDHSFPKGVVSGNDIVGPGQKQTEHLRLPIRLTGGRLFDFVHGLSAFYVHGRIEYQDIIGESYFTNFRFYCTADRRGIMRADVIGNEMN